MAAMLDFLKGKKTYIGIVAGAIYSVLIMMDIVPSEEAVWTIIAVWTGVAYRAALSEK